MASIQSDSIAFHLICQLLRKSVLIRFLHILVRNVPHAHADPCDASKQQKKIHQVLVLLVLCSSACRKAEGTHMSIEYAYKYVCMYVCMYVCIYVCMYAWMYACMYVPMHVFMCSCIYVYIHVCKYMYTCLSIYLSIYLSIHPSIYLCPHTYDGRSHSPCMKDKHDAFVFRSLCKWYVHNFRHE